MCRVCRGGGSTPPPPLRSGPRYGVIGAPRWTMPQRRPGTTVGQAAATAPRDSATFGCHAPGATASSHHELANTEPCGDAWTSSSYVRGAAAAASVPCDVRDETFMDLR